MKSINLIPAITLLILSGCGGSGQSNDDLITVDVTKSYPQKELILQDFLDVEYIPLETTDEFLTSAYVQAITKNFMLVRNTIQAARGHLYLFDRKGKGLKDIYRLGQSAEEYQSPFNIVLDEENNEIFVNDYLPAKIMVYDLEGNFKRSFNHLENTRYGAVYNLDRDHLICYDVHSGLEIEPIERNNFWIVSKQDGKMTNEIQIFYEKKISKVLEDNQGRTLGISHNRDLIPYHDSFLLVETSADTIFTYSRDHQMAPFIVKTPSIQSMNPEEFLYPGVITDQYCFLQTVKKEHDPTEPRSRLLKTDLVYDKADNKIFEYVVYNNDFTTKRAIANLVDKEPILTVINSDEIAFAEQMEAFELVEAYKNGQLKGKLKEIAATLNEESNSVIMLAKYKKERPLIALRSAKRTLFPPKRDF